MKDSLDVKIGPEELLSLCKSWPFNFLRNYHNIESDYATSYLFHDIKKCALNQSNKLLCVRDKSGLAAATVERCVWDTRYFGIPMGKIPHFIFSPSPKENILLRLRLIKSLLVTAAQSRIKHLTIRVDGEDALTQLALEKYGFRKITSEFIHIIDETTQKRQIHKHPEIQTRKIQKKDLSQIIDTISGFVPNLLNRFYLDNKLPRKKCENYYIESIKNSCLKQNADDVFLGVKEKQILGFYATKFIKLPHRENKKNLCYSVLLGIKPQERRKYSAMSFCNKVFQEIIGQKYFITGRVCAHNIAMMSFLSKMGARLITTQYCMHKYLG